MLVLLLTEHKVSPLGEVLTFEGGSNTLAKPVLDVGLEPLL